MDADIDTFPAALWALQALLGIETMPPALRLAVYIPSASAHIPVREYPEYQSLVHSGIVNAAGQVHHEVIDWLTIISRPDLEVQLTIRRPGDEPDTIKESLTVFCRMESWLAAITLTPADAERRRQVAAQIGFEGDPNELPREWVDQIRITYLGESSDLDRQTEMITEGILSEIGTAAPARIDGANIELSTFLQASGVAGNDAEALTAMLMRAGITESQCAVLTEMMALDRSALATVSARHVIPGASPHERAVGRTVVIADSGLGRVSMAQSVSDSGTLWVSLWPGEPATVRGDITDFVSTVIAPRVHLN
ncbi:ESX secretion-associated protein EspG [Mycobacteroides abscessus]|uniref:ESX secretion-associated protein EspG n=1 Tax=Mycobacteroides abscessus TaxID=36809 RepID=UPI00266D3956|nr:ESX secretion-associated protein EspG [Mycobacteroides abscessus]MDO3042044.1 ESX secretion-associated protein EspG [Mycobacteroides abscessus subsp. abscessus]MDO3111477.1 ESX secretion-associated protein EspG [Mycobacteroides abscessus subsp. massiliense]